MRKLFILLSILLIFGSGKVSAASGAQAKAYNTFISNGYFNGLSPNININDYSGSKKITRVEFIALLNNLYKLGGASDIRFVDVMPGNWFYDDVMVAVGNNYADGYAEAVFLPMGELTREQAIVMCARFLGLETREGKKTIFMDDNQISDWGKKYISAMYDNGYLDTFENPNLFPKNSLSWDEALNFLMDIYGQPREVADAVALDAGGMVRGSHDLVYRAKPTGGDRAQRQTIHQNDDGVTRRNIDDILEDEQYRYNNVRRVVSDEGVLSESEERGYAVSRDPEEAVSEKVGKYIEKGYIDEGRAGEEYADEIYEKEYTDEEYADEEYIEEEYTDEEYADEGYEKEYTDEEYADEEYIEEEYTD
ncbi:MAG: hypothetical protein LBV08_03870, partial [Clostridiales bacterium]|nr:hypothetical protein [Clostridiales bacterium]